MSRYDCEICHGAGFIRLPVHSRAVSAVFSAEPVALNETSRQYPCPECAETVSSDRVAILRYQGRALMPYPDKPLPPDYLAAIKRQSAMELVAALDDAGMITFKTGPANRQFMEFEVRSTLGVVAPSIVATMEQRIAQNQQAVAMEVVVEAKRLIANWGSEIGMRLITKREAMREVEQALDTVLRERAAKGNHQHG